MLHGNDFDLPIEVYTTMPHLWEMYMLNPSQPICGLMQKDAVFFFGYVVSRVDNMVFLQLWDPTWEPHLPKNPEGIPVGEFNWYAFKDLYTGWWLGHPSEKYEFVNWDDEIPNWMGK